MIYSFTGEYTMEYCENCHLSLENAELTLPWEDGDNRYAYVTCLHCGWKTIQYGYGEDDE